MKKWKLVVCGLLFGLLFGMTAQAAPEDEIKVELVEDVTVDESFTPMMRVNDSIRRCKVSLQPVPWDTVTRKPTEDDIMLKADEVKSAHAFKIQVEEVQENDGTWRPYSQKDDIYNWILVKLRCPDFADGFRWYDLLVWDEDTNTWDSPGADPSIAKDKDGNHVSDYYGTEEEYMRDGIYSQTFRPRVTSGIYAVVLPERQTGQNSGQTPVQKPEFRLISQSVTVGDSGEAVDVLTSDTAQELSSDTIKAVLNSGRQYTVYKKEIQLQQNGSPKELAPGESVELTFEVPDVRSGSDVQVLHFDSAVGWENDTAEIVSKGENQVTVRFRSLSPIAVLVYNEEGRSHSSGRSNRTEEPENEFWATPLSSGGAVMVNGAAADLQIGPSPRTFSETDARIVLGTTEPCSVYTAELWLLDQATKNIVLPQAGGSDVTVNIPGVTKNSNVRVRIWLNGTDEYRDLVPSETGNGYIRVKMTDMGPVAICVDGNGAAAQTPAPAAAVTK